MAGFGDGGFGDSGGGFGGGGDDPFSLGGADAFGASDNRRSGRSSSRGSRRNRPSGRREADSGFDQRQDDRSVHFGGHETRDFHRDDPLDRDRDRDRGGRGYGGAPPPPSALDEALGRANDPYGRASDPYGRDYDHGRPGSPSRGRDPAYGGYGHDQPISAGLGRDSSALGPGGGGYGRDPPPYGAQAPRGGFGLSLTDLPDPMGNGVARGRGPNGPYPHERERQHSPTWQRWNPLDGIKRHWGETPVELMGLPSPSVHSPYTGLLQHVPLEDELNRTEGRVQALRMKIAHLESGLHSGVPGDGHVKVVVPFLLAGGQLGLTMRGTTVTAILDPRAEQFGWSVGDRVVKVNDFPVTTGQDFTAELARATAAYRASSRPMVFDVFRQRAVGLAGPCFGSPPGSRGHSPIRGLSPNGSFVGPPFHPGMPGLPQHALGPHWPYPHGPCGPGPYGPQGMLPFGSTPPHGMPPFGSAPLHGLPAHATSFGTSGPGPSMPMLGPSVPGPYGPWPCGPGPCGPMGSYTGSPHFAATPPYPDPHISNLHASVAALSHENTALRSRLASPPRTQPELHQAPRQLSPPRGLQTAPLVAPASTPFVVPGTGHAALGARPASFSGLPPQQRTTTFIAT